ncbi:Pr6Pr family membrane protein [Actinocatenispora rupis]|uniref:FAR-17a/AIG1-like protein n=1 Tax=Actinocatenispora rupis TaxID=519421 RepID=A0A8J3NF07_9ACTN|nr:Pr6Pr family membrane protein [Actinocatenispora rupis]GID14420.1 hypothetical protein Aru02nite_53090 [Actinocatenispora rupis]
MHRVTVLAIGRLAAAALGLSAVVYVALRAGPVVFNYFTVLSNVLGVVALATAAVRGLRGDPPSARFGLFRGAAALYLATTGVVYWTLLYGADVDTPAWSNYVLHLVLPVVAVADWLAEPARVAYRQVGWWLVFPLAYLAYTLVRGPFADWYPYPFLDPRTDGGYAKVAGMSVGVAVLIVALGLLIAWLAGLRRPASAR